MDKQHIKQANTPTPSNRLIRIHDSTCSEFYYIQMEKYARQAVSEGVKSADDLHVSADSEIYRVLNLHYNRNNHIEVCRNQVRYIMEQHNTA